MPRLKRIESDEEGGLLNLMVPRDDIEEKLNDIGKFLRQLKRENERLKADKEALEGEVQALRSASALPSKGSGSAAKVKALERELSSAKKDAVKYRSRYEKLRAAELRREQQELNEGVGYAPTEWEDKYRNMKKLLRRFRSLLEEVVLEDPEDGKYPDCAICFEEMSRKFTVAAFPCEHIFHLDCIRKLDTHAKTEPSSLGNHRRLACPTCRTNWQLTDLLEVTRTAGEQWAELTDVATEWANMDGERDEAETEGPDLSDRASSPSFIENDMETATAEEEEEEEETVESIDQAPQATTASASKRKRMEALVSARRGKKQKR